MSDALIRVVRSTLPAALPDKLGVAVSGGSDSMALLHLLRTVCNGAPTQLLAVTVDHGLRAEATDEAEKVAADCEQIGIFHETLTWTGWDGAGNTQSAARDARYGLIAGWAQNKGVSAVALGHTIDDQAETVLMRLARGAGPDGLSAMSTARDAHGLLWLRPLLTTPRAALRAFLTESSIAWSDDPSNEDARYDRIRARRALEVLSPLGIDPEVLSRVAGNMRRTRDALDQHMLEAARRFVTVKAGALCIDWPGFQDLPAETARRLLSGALRWIGGGAYPPRASALEAFETALAQDHSATLAGCHARRVAQTLWIFREFRAVAGLETSPQVTWDGRWRLTGNPPPRGSTLRVLGDEGLRQCPDWRAGGLPRDLLRATPGLWQGDVLLSAPLAGLSDGRDLSPASSRDAFFAALLSH